MKYNLPFAHEDNNSYTEKEEDQASKQSANPDAGGVVVGGEVRVDVDQAVIIHVNVGVDDDRSGEWPRSSFIDSRYLDTDGLMHIDVRNIDAIVTIGRTCHNISHFFVVISTNFDVVAINYTISISGIKWQPIDQQISIDKGNIVNCRRCSWKILQGGDTN